MTEYLPKICETCLYFQMDEFCVLKEFYVRPNGCCSKYEMGDYGEGYEVIE